jgi:dienelactone hydrolase
MAGSAAGSSTPSAGAPSMSVAGTGATATAGMSGASTAGMSGAAAPSGTGFPAVAVADLNKNGPYMSMTVQNTGPNNKYTIYRPQQLAPGGAKNPFIAWISGGGSMASQYTLLPHLATHSFVVVASNTVPDVGQQVALGKEMVAAVDWMLAEIQRTGSDYAGKVDGTKVAAMGYSMGGLAATAAGADPRWTTTVHISGGAGDGTIKNLHAPAAMLCGASGVDIAGANCATDFDQATTPVFYGVFNGGDHLGVRTAPYSDRISAVITGWLRWQLMGDPMLKSMFVGDMCTVCKDSNWTVKQKNLQ